MSEFYVVKVDKGTNGVKEVFRRNIQYDPYRTEKEAFDAAATRLIESEPADTELAVIELKARLKKVPQYTIQVTR